MTEEQKHGAGALCFVVAPKTSGGADGRMDARIESQTEKHRQNRQTQNRQADRQTDTQDKTHQTDAQDKNENTAKAKTKKNTNRTQIQKPHTPPHPTSRGLAQKLRRDNQPREEKQVAPVSTA